VRIEDVEAAASVHQHLREPRVPDDRVNHQGVLGWGCGSGDPHG
jgi:hypothetical protein